MTRGRVASEQRRKRHPEHEKGAKPSTLRDYRWLLAELDQVHRRGSGRSPGLLMSAFGDRGTNAITTRDVADYLRRLDKAGATPRTVNEHRQVISAIYGYGMREDTYRLAVNLVVHRALSDRVEGPTKG